MNLARTSLLLALALAAPSARAARPDGFALQTFEPAPAGDPLFRVPEASAAGRDAAAALTLSWATEPLLLRHDGDAIPGGRIVHRQFWAWAAASLPLGDRVLLDVAAPVALHQTGSKPFADLAQVGASGLGDVRVGARLPFWRGAGAAVAVALDAWLPTGAKKTFSSDEALRLEPKLVASGERGAWLWGASAGYLLREDRDLLYTSTAPAFTFTAGAAWRRGEFRVGPELSGRLQSGGVATSPVEVLLGGHWSRGAIDAGLGVGTGLDRAPGAAPYRVIGQLTWFPGRARRLAAERDATARAETARLEAERLAADRAAAGRAAAEQAEAARLEAERLAAEQAARAEAERLAAEKLAAEKLAAERAAAALAEAKAAGDSSRVTLTKEKIEILQSVQFDTNRDTIKPVSFPILEAVARVLKGHPELTQVRVEGHTDSDGSVAANTDLSARRAAAVKRWMVEKGGVEAGRLETEGFGPQRPIADNKTAEGRARNRRVEFRIVQ